VYVHSEAKRKNNPPAKIAAEGYVPILPKAEYFYSPRRPPELRFDSTGHEDELPELLAKATKEPLAEAEAWALAEALRQHEPWLEWTEKREAKSFSVDPVALHIHERVSAQAILKVAAREDANRSLFADPEQEYNEAVQFYRHDVDWSNRLILGDSLQVMSSLARREDLAGKIQMIFMDPPYGVKFRSNFQPEVGDTAVSESEQDLTREPETVKAYRDTWRLGVHTYLAYLRERLMLAKELLAESGSIFVQISDENVHLVRTLMTEVFGSQNFCSQIQFKKTGSASSGMLASVCDYLLWYAKAKASVYVNKVFEQKKVEDLDTTFYDRVETPTGELRRLSEEERADPSLIGNGLLLTRNPIVSPEKSENLSSPVVFEGKQFPCPEGRHWATDLTRLIEADRITQKGNTLRFKRYATDAPLRKPTNTWMDLGSGGFVGAAKRYVVQTDARVIQRCLFLTTKPGDLVLDPTCGGGTTALAAEQWGRRWITIDTSRVGIAIARQALLTQIYPYYRLQSAEVGVSSGFLHEKVAKIEPSTISKNFNLDPIFAKHAAVLRNCLEQINHRLGGVTDGLRKRLRDKLLRKASELGQGAVSEGDRRRWSLPERSHMWELWQVPFEPDEDYPSDLKGAVLAFREAWKQKHLEVESCIRANADPIAVVDRPIVDKGTKRVSGPFTVEAVQPPELSLGDSKMIEVGFSGEPEELSETFVIREVQLGESAQNVEAYLSEMVRLLRMDGLRFPNNKEKNFTRLHSIFASGTSGGIHAEGRWVNLGDADEDPNGDDTVGVVLGPQYGPITAKMIEEIIKPAARRYDDLVFAGFSFDGPAQAVIDEGVPRLRMHIAHIRPDVNPGMTGLLKEQPGSQLFTVFGRPRTKVTGPDSEGLHTVEMEGVDIYNPVTNTVVDTGAAKVAAWFVDGDYDGRTFCITQAFFPDKTAWEKLSKALDGVVDPERFEAFSGTISLPFPIGKHKCVAVKVIDPRGNEVMRVHNLRTGS
jgi:adenine-specific DNA-methyltransferase